MYCTRGYMLSICLLTGDADLGHWLRCYLPGFPVLKLLFFPSGTNKDLGGNNLRLGKYYVSPQSFAH